MKEYKHLEWVFDFALYMATRPEDRVEKPTFIEELNALVRDGWEPVWETYRREDQEEFSREEIFLEREKKVEITRIEVITETEDQVRVTLNPLTMEAIHFLSNYGYSDSDINQLIEDGYMEVSIPKFGVKL